MQKRKVSVLFVSHDLGLVAEPVDRVVVMYRGKVIEQMIPIRSFGNPEHPHGKSPDCLQTHSWRIPRADYPQWMISSTQETRNQKP